MTLYAVVLTFPGEVAEGLNRLREKYNRYVSYTIGPHLTLEYPFTPMVDVAIINTRLEAVAKRTKPFTLVLSEIKYFEGANNVAYVAVKDRRLVVDLHVDIFHSLEELVKEEYDGRYALKHFTPHVTIGEHIPDEVFPAVKKEFSDYKLDYRSEVASFALFSGGMDGVWEPVRVFGLSK
jgi:2'-5' RNA ligase